MADNNNPFEGAVAEPLAVPDANPPGIETMPMAAVSAEAGAAAPPAPAPGGPEVPAVKLPAGAQPKLVVQRGLKLNVEYPIYEGHNFIGRADEKPVDID